MAPITETRNGTVAPARRKYPVMIIGAGLNGLAAAHELKKVGIVPAVLDGSDKPAAAWRSRHDQLRLNTHRLISYLPGKRIPRRYGAFPARDDIVTYLESYEKSLGVPVYRGVSIDRIDRIGKAWRLESSDRTWHADDVIIATGNERVPAIPEWPGREGFTGELLHAAHLGSIERFRNRRMLVVGAGNSGVDVLNHLMRIRTKKVWVSVRKGPAILPGRLLGMPLQLLAPLMVRMPAKVTDMLMATTQRLSFGDLKKYNLAGHPDGVATRLIREGVAPAFDDGFVRALKAGRATVVPQIDRFDGGEILLSGGQAVRPDTVICATGYRPGLEGLAGHLGVLNESGRPIFNGSECHPNFPGLWFMGMVPPLAGVFYAARGEARRLAKAIRKRHRVHQQTSVSASTRLLKAADHKPVE